MQKLLNSPWVLALVLLAMLAALLVISGVDLNTIHERLTGEAQLNADVKFWIGPSGITATIANNNTYTWTGLQISADRKYPCEFTPNTRPIKPNESVFVTACHDEKNNTIGFYSSLFIQTDWSHNQYQAGLGPN